MNTASTRAARIEAALIARFAPVAIAVADESARHAGHAGARPGGETHYAVRLVADAFQGMNRLARHRAVHEALREEFATGLHALTLDIRTPLEAGQG